MLRRSPDYEQRWSHGQILWSPKGFFEDLITYQSSLFPGKLINIKKCKKNKTHTHKKPLLIFCTVKLFPYPMRALSDENEYWRFLWVIHQTHCDHHVN